jgi:hypothetical protein
MLTILITTREGVRGAIDKPVKLQKRVNLSYLLPARLKKPGSSHQARVLSRIFPPIYPAWILDGNVQSNGSVERLSLTFATTPTNFVSPLQQICSTAGAYE